MSTYREMFDVIISIKKFEDFGVSNILLEDLKD
jgi:cyclopropane fatty-acyl-phospholipid synthase-like methyltransferase